MSDNKMACKCGKHFGTGQWSAEHRAAVYGWLRDTKPNLMTAQQRRWLFSWERAHGAVMWKNDAGKITFSEN